MTILVTIPRGLVRDTFIPPKVASQIEAVGEVIWNDSDAQMTPEQLRARIAGVDICITGWGTPCFDQTVLEGADKLRIIAHTGGSVATLVTEAAYDRGIHVISGNELYAKSVAEGVIAYALCGLRDIPYYADTMQAQGWHPPEIWTEGLFGQAVGLVGFGAVARHTVPLLHAFECRIKVHADHVTPEEEARYRIEKTSLEDIFSTCKIVSLHTSATPEYRHMVDDRLLSMLPDGALLINTARGMVIDEEALGRHVATGRFKAVLDVYTQEPLPMDSPLRNRRNVLLIPHMAGPTVDRRPFVTEALLDEIRALQQGKASWLAITREQMRRMTIDR